MTSLQARHVIKDLEDLTSLLHFIHLYNETFKTFNPFMIWLHSYFYEFHYTYSLGL
jgi:hypothetical protein